MYYCVSVFVETLTEKYRLEGRELAKLIFCVVIYYNKACVNLFCHFVKILVTKFISQCFNIQTLTCKLCHMYFNLVWFSVRSCLTWLI